MADLTKLTNDEIDSVYDHLLEYKTYELVDWILELLPQTELKKLVKELKEDDE